MFAFETVNLIKKYICFAVVCSYFFLSPILLSEVMADTLKNNKLSHSNDSDDIDDTIAYYDDYCSNCSNCNTQPLCGYCWYKRLIGE